VSSSTWQRSARRKDPEAGNGASADSKPHGRSTSRSQARTRTIFANRALLIMLSSGESVVTAVSALGLSGEAVELAQVESKERCSSSQRWISGRPPHGSRADQLFRGSLLRRGSSFTSRMISRRAATYVAMFWMFFRLAGFGEVKEEGDEYSTSLLPGG